MKPFFAIWIPTVTVLCHIYITKDYGNRWMFGEFGHVLATILCLPGVVAFGVLMYSLGLIALRKIR